MNTQTKLNIVLTIIVIAIFAFTALRFYNVYSEVNTPIAKPQQSSYQFCEYRTVKGTCGSWTTKTH